MSSATEPLPPAGRVGGMAALRRGAAWLHLGLALAIALGVFVQVYLIGAYVFGAGSDALEAHTDVGVQLMSSVGEKETIVRYPELIEALVAVGGDPLAATTNLAELRAVITPLGFRPSARVSTDELRRLTVPTLLIWGDHDPVGAVEVAEGTATAIPEAQLELLDAGHVPYFGHPERASEQVSGFVRPVRDG